MLNFDQAELSDGVLRLSVHSAALRENLPD